jgi:opacity protein-like surface antigen
MTKFIIAGLSALAALTIATASSAENSKPDYARSGWYLGVGGGPAFDFLDDAVEENTGGIVEFTAGGTFNARGGYRLTSWFATELMYEGVYRLGTEVLGVEVGNTDLHSVLVNLKFILPIWRIHPYFTLGPGVQYGNFNGFGPADPFDTSRWDFMLRFGLGLDAYITEHWLINLDVAPSIRFADYGDIPSETTDNVTMTVSAGIQYRF